MTGGFPSSALNTGNGRGILGVVDGVNGTNGIVLELEVALAPALDWIESIATFGSFDAALEFASGLGSAPGLVKKEVCFLGAPVPDHMTALAEYLPKGCHPALVVMAEPSQ